MECSCNTCKASKGIITNANGDKLGYGEVVKEAALLEVPEDVKLKEIKDFTIIGQEIVNVDIDKIITGKPLFGLDYKTEGMVYASVLRPPAFGQILESFDATEAKKVKGVIDVITIGDKVRKYVKSGKKNWTFKFLKQIKWLLLQKILGQQ